MYFSLNEENGPLFLVWKLVFGAYIMVLLLVLAYKSDKTHTALAHPQKHAIKSIVYWITHYNPKRMNGLDGGGGCGSGGGS